MTPSRFRAQVLETRLAVRDLQLQLAGTALNAGFWTWEPVTGVLSLSTRCQALLGVDAESPPTFDTFLARVHADDQPRVRQGLLQALRQKQDFALEFRTVTGGADLRCEGRVHVSSVDRGQWALSGLIRPLDTACQDADGVLAPRAGSAARRIDSLRRIEKATLINRMQSEVAESLNRVRQRLAALSAAALTPAQRDQFAALERETDAGVEAVRSAIFEMEPPGVAELGFAGALERHATEQAAAAGIALSLSIPQDTLPAPEAALESLYLAARAGIDNVVRHARASSMEVSVRHDRHAIIVRVVDNGIGIRNADLMKDNAFSLFVSAERLAGSGGALRVTAAPGGGTLLEASLPLGMDLGSPREGLASLRVA